MIAKTAEMAVQAALTGHLVLSTLHTNDAPSAIARLIEVGIPSYLINATLIGVVAQRLVRKLCSHCKQEVGLELLDWQALIKPWTTLTAGKVSLMRKVVSNADKPALSGVLESMK